MVPAIGKTPFLVGQGESLGLGINIDYGIVHTLQIVV